MPGRVSELKDFFLLPMLGYCSSESSGEPKLLIQSQEIKNTNPFTT